MRRPHAVSLLLALGAAASTGACRDDPGPAPASARVTVRLDLARALAALPEPRPARADLEGTWVLSDTRDAARAEFGAPLAFAPLSGAARDAGRVRIASAFALERATDAAIPDGARVEAELRLVVDGRAEVLARLGSDARRAAEAWAGLTGTATLPARGRAHVEVLVTWSGAAAAPPGVAPLAAVPRAHAPRGERRNVLVISIDTLRADHLGFHGYGRDTSPRLDAFVARGALFEHAISTSPWTLPSYGTLFTGLEPAHHRAGISARREAAFGTGREEPNGDYQALADGIPTLASIVRDAGYATAAFVSNPFLDPGSGVDRGFDSFAQYLNRARAGVELARAWIKSQGDAPWFVFVHLMDPHAPYSPPPPYDTRFADVALRDLPGGHPSVESLRAAQPDEATRARIVGAYDGEIAYTDARIGELLDALEASGALARTLVVVHADHGEEFWEHGAFEHGHALHEESLHVPLAFVAPGLVTAGLRVAERTSTAHACATILDLLGLPTPEGIDAASLAPLLRGGGDGSARPAPRPCISESLLYGPREEKAWSFGPEKLVTDGAARTRLYDLANDPREDHDLASERAARADELRGLLLGRARDAAARAGAAASAAFDAERRAELEGFGYPGADDR